MKKLLITLLINLSLSAHIYAEDYCEDLKKDSKEVAKCSCENKEELKECTAYYASGKLFVQTKFNDEALDMKSYFVDLKSYYEDGKIQSTIKTINGNLELKTYHSNGNLIAEISFFDIANLPSEFRANHELSQETMKKIEANTYVENLNTKIKLYYPNGNPNILVQTKDGLIEGEQIMWYENGNVMTKMPVIQGKRNGKAIDFYKTGELKALSDFKDDKEISTTVFYKSGKEKCEYKADQNGNVPLVIVKQLQS